jgi:hypothetical protein
MDAAQQAQAIGDDVLGLAAQRVEAGQGLAAHLLERGGLQARLAQHGDDEPHGLHRVLALGAEGQGQATGRVLHLQFDLEGVEAVTQLLAVERARAFVEQGGRAGRPWRAGRAAIADRPGAAAPGRPPGCRASAWAAARPAGRWLNCRRLACASMASGAASKAATAAAAGRRHEVLQLCGHVHLRRLGRALRLLGRDVERQRAVGGQQALAGDALQILQLERLDAVAQQEEEAPVAGRQVFAEHGADGLRVAVQLVPAVQPARAGALQFGLR